jgi:vesicle transport protein SEC22
MANGGGGAMDTLNNELQDVTRIMTKNMEELLWRGDSLDSMSYGSTQLCTVTNFSFRDVSSLYFVAL